MRWSNLTPELGIVQALTHAGIRSEDGDQNTKRAWSERFADGCAIAIANELRNVEILRRKRILPIDLATGTEPLTPLGSGTSKRIDVTVADPVLGLEVGVSLKGLNFKDPGNGNYDKNLTGRLYELGDEVRLVHEHLPNAFMVGIFFLPLEAASDKITGLSSFAHAVTKLGERTGRLDSALPAHSARCDMGFVALYTAGNASSQYPSGVVRFHSVRVAPPRRGRPKVENTLSLVEMVNEIQLGVTKSAKVDWAEPEADE